MRLTFWHVAAAVLMAWAGVYVLAYFCIQDLAPKIIHFLTANGVKGL